MTSEKKRTFVFRNSNSYPYQEDPQLNQSLTEVNGEMLFRIDDSEICSNQHLYESPNKHSQPQQNPIPPLPMPL